MFRCDRDEKKLELKTDGELITPQIMQVWQIGRKLHHIGVKLDKSGVYILFNCSVHLEKSKCLVLTSWRIVEFNTTLAQTRHRCTSMQWLEAGMWLGDGTSWVSE